MSKVLIGMSGGVDSTISTQILKDQGYDVEGVYMKLHNKSGYHEENIAKAQKAADFIGVSLHILDLQNEFDDKVFKPFVDNYEKGITPNPCAVCNKNIKFGKMVDFADEIGAEFIATGHYLQHDGQFLYEAKDKNKDQSYFLFNINPSVIPRLLFPLGQKIKTEIKEYAKTIPELKSFGEQAESSEICFVETVYTDVLKKYVAVDQEGDVLNLKGEIVGKHKGYMHYTIGKRKGFSVNGAHDPHFVLKIIPELNQIIVGLKEDLSIFVFKIKDLNMFLDQKEIDCSVKIRYRTKSVACHLSIQSNKAIVKLKESVFGVAPGQAAVFYDGEKLLGGGWIV
jgi:tRNA-specific 2-thiouridylase